MEQLFSCRNCVHNSGQSLNIGAGSGYCIKHDSVVFEPEWTTCKYLHRKDLPRFVVEEGIREHAAEFATFSGLVHLKTKRPIERLTYSEKFAWERKIFDPMLHTLAQYQKSSPSWVFVQAFSGGVDGRRSLAHAALVRRYMDRCGSWVSSYRLILALIQELPTQPHFDSESLVGGDEADLAEIAEEANWDVVFTRIAGIQEYGFHSGLENLMWATDHLNGSMTDLNWPNLQAELQMRRSEWTNEIIAHAASENVFFPKPSLEAPPDERPEQDA